MTTPGGSPVGRFFHSAAIPHRARRRSRRTERPRVLAGGTAYLDEHVENPDGIEFQTLLSVKTAPDQAKEIRAQAKQLGMQTCALADSIEQTSMGGISP